MGMFAAKGRDEKVQQTAVEIKLESKTFTN